MLNPNKHIFDLFMKEKTRYPDLTVFYRKASGNQPASMRYVVEDGVLTVIFEESGTEKFYFKKPDEKGVGTLFQTISEEGAACSEEDAAVDVPAKWTEIAQTYRFERHILNI